jgi:hypothetical protein
VERTLAAVVPLIKRRVVRLPCFVSQQVASSQKISRILKKCDQIAMLKPLDESTIL